MLRATADFDDEEYWSVFVYFRFRHAWMLFTGDASSGYEEKLLPRLKALNERLLAHKNVAAVG